MRPLIHELTAKHPTELKPERKDIAIQTEGDIEVKSVENNPKKSVLLEKEVRQLISCPEFTLLTIPRTRHNMRLSILR
jgi:hypothetical protein